MGTRKHPPVSFQNSQVSIITTIRPKGAPNLPDSVAPSPVCSGSFSPLRPLSSASRPTSSYRPRRGSARSLFRSRSSSSLLDEFFRYPERSAVWGGTVQEPVTADNIRKHDADADADTATPTDRDSVMDHQAVSDLVDFLKNHAPPPDNFMSIPDDGRGAPERGRWLGIRPLSRRSKSTPKRPAPMQLPDSAVAGTTIGGHRHIAISIPVEYSPFGPNARSQYPVYDKDSGRPPFGEDGSVVRYTDSRGVVTVLRTVSETRESLIADDSIASPRNKFHAPVSVTATEFPRPPLSRTQSLNEPGNLPTTKSPRDYHTASLPPTPLSYTRPPNLSPREAKRPDMRDSSYDDSPVIPNFKPEDTRIVIPRVKPEDKKAWPLQGQVQAQSPPPPSPRRPVPSRWTVFPTGPGATNSIDSVIYGQRRPKGAHGSEPQPLNRSATYAGRDRAHSYRSHKSHKSTASDMSADFIVAQAMPMVKVCSARNSIVDLKSLASRSPLTEKFVEKPAESMATADEPPVSPAPSATSFAESRKSRKEKVREKRKRDIEASRASRDRRKLDTDDEYSRRRSSLAPSEISTAPADTESDHSKFPARGSTPSITPVIVVAEVKPSTPPQSPAIPTFTSPGRTSPQSARTLSSSSTPPHTPRGRSPTRSARLARHSLSPTHQRLRTPSATSTTSSTRRREPPPPAMTTRNFSRRTLVSSPTRIQAARSLDTLYEERILEMERRMKRLECSGDTWLTAIVPVLDSLNRTLVMMQDDRRFAASSPASPVSAFNVGSDAVLVSSPSRSESGVMSSVPPVKIARRSTLNEMDLLGMKSNTNGEGEMGERKTGASGLDSLEPIMRELQEMSRICAKHQPVQSIGVVESNAAR